MGSGRAQKGVGVKTWNDCKQLIAQFWPEWEPTKEQVVEYRDRLEHKNHRWLETAIRDHYALDCPKDGVFLSPRLSKIITRYAAIAEAGAAEERANSIGPSRYRAAWVESRNGQPYAMASVQAFPTMMQALDHASARGSKPDAIPVGEVRGEDDMDEVMRDDRVMRNALCGLSADQIESVCVKALDLPLGLTKESIADHPIEWKRFTVGCVWAVAERMGLCK